MNNLTHAAAKGTLRELQLHELDLFKSFASFCEKNELTYYALGGTLLGAIRHQGFIPWDDDMDLGMPREDYEVFLRTFSPDDPNVRLHWVGNDVNHTRYFARIEDERIKILRTDMEPPELTPAWIDVFPLDGMPEGGIGLALAKASILLHRALFRFGQSGKSRAVITNDRPFYEKVLIRLQNALCLYRIFPFKKMWARLDFCLKKHPYATSSNIINAMGHWKFKEMFPKSCYGEGAWYPFEDTVIFGPVDYDTVCRSLYGDYMTPVDTGHHQPKPTSLNQEKEELHDKGNTDLIND